LTILYVFAFIIEGILITDVTNCIKTNFDSLIKLLNPDVTKTELKEETENFKKSFNDLKILEMYELGLPTTHQCFHCMDDCKNLGAIYIWWGKVFEIQHFYFKKKLFNYFLKSPSNFLMSEYNIDLKLNLLISTENEKYLFFNEQTRISFFKKSNTNLIKIKKYFISEFDIIESIKMKEIRILNLFTHCYYKNEKILIKKKGGKKLINIFSIILVSSLNVFEDQNIFIVYLNKHTNTKFTNIENILGKPFLFENNIINYIK
jgi:hypothetical protein